MSMNNTSTDETTEKRTRAEIMEALKNISTETDQNKVEEYLDGISDEDLYKFTVKMKQQIKNGDVNKKDLVPFLPIFDTANISKTTPEALCIISNIIGKNGVRAISQGRLLKYCCAVSEDAENIIMRQKASAHKSSVTKFDKYPQEVKETYLSVEEQLTQLEEMRKNKEIDKQTYDVIKKDVKLAGEADVRVTSIFSHMKDNHIDELVSKLKILENAINAMDAYSTTLGRKFDTLLKECDDNAEVCNKIDEYTTSFENHFNMTFEQNYKQVFKLKREVEDELNKALGTLKKDRVDLKGAKEFESKLFAHRNEELTKNVFEKQGRPFTEKDLEKADWENMESILEQTQKVLSECQKEFEEINLTYSKAKRGYDQVCQKIKTFFDPTHNKCGVVPKVVREF